MQIRVVVPGAQAAGLRAVAAARCETVSGLVASEARRRLGLPCPKAKTHPAGARLVSVYLTPADRRAISENARAAGVSDSSYVRALCANGEDHLVGGSTADLTRGREALARVLNNLWQVSSRLRAAGDSPAVRRELADVERTRVDAMRLMVDLQAALLVRTKAGLYGRA